MDKVTPINWEGRVFPVSRHEIAGREDNIAQRRFLWDCYIKLKELVVPLRGKAAPDNLILMWESDYQTLVAELASTRGSLEQIVEDSRL